MSDDVPVSPFHFWHRWTRWTKPVRVVYEQDAFVAFSGSYVSGFRTYDGPIPEKVEHSYNEQYRDCAVCGAQEMRRV